MTINELSESRPITRVLVTGGAGSVGIEVLKELQQQKKWYQVKVLDRNRSEVLRKLKPFRKDFQLILGDLGDPDILKNATADVDFVIHLAAVSYNKIFFHDILMRDLWHFCDLFIHTAKRRWD